MTPAVTDSVTPGLTVRMAVLALLLLKTSELTVAPAVTVTAAPARITALSLLAGTAPPTQVVVLFQSPPEVVEITVAARVATAPKMASAASVVLSFINRFLERAGQLWCRFPLLLLIDPDAAEPARRKVFSSPTEQCVCRRLALLRKCKP